MIVYVKGEGGIPVEVQDEQLQVGTGRPIEREMPYYRVGVMNQRKFWNKSRGQ